MKRLVVLAFAALLAAVPYALGRSAIGQGGIQDSDGVIAVNFELHQGTTAGHVLVAADGLEDYPDVVIQMNHVDFAHFGRHSVTFEGSARLQDQPVTVRGSAFDNGHRDRVAFTVKDAEGNVVFQFNKALTSGDISIR